jgi:hypothetical protein
MLSILLWKIGLRFLTLPPFQLIYCYVLIVSYLTERVSDMPFSNQIPQELLEIPEDCLDSQYPFVRFEKLLLT